MPFAPEPPKADDVAPRGTKEWRQAVNAHRAWIANELWMQQHYGGLNLTDKGAMANALGGLGVTNEVGGGRHAYNLFLGNLGQEGFGMSNVPGREGMAYAMEAYMPDWRFNLDRAIQGGMPRTDANAQFIPGQGGYSGAAWTPGGPMTAPTPGSTVPGLSGTSPSYAPLEDDEDAWMKKRNTLGSLGFGD